MEKIGTHGLTKTAPGQRYGRLVVCDPVRTTTDSRGMKHVIWRCLCDCGGSIETRSCNLRRGDTKSCGCLNKETGKAKPSWRHGETPRKGGSPEHTAWRNMHGRCANPKSPAYPWYGGRGIAVCSEWLDFSVFLRDMGRRPSAEHSLERVDVDGNYTPENTRWATRMEQGANKRNNRHLTAGGETLHMQEWCRRTGLNQRTLWDRLKRGWSEERALMTPVTTKRER